MISFLRGTRVPVLCLSRQHAFYYESPSLKNVNCFSTNKSTDANKLKDEDLSSESGKKQTEEFEVSDFMKKIHAQDHRQPIKYRRQNFSDPIQRTLGILADDFRIMFYNIKYVIRGIFRLVNGYDPDSGEKMNSSEIIQKNKNETSHSSSLLPGDEKSVKESRLNDGEHDTKIQHAKLNQDNSINILEKKSSLRKRLYTALTPPSESEVWPGHCDVLIIGGGAIGSSIAYHLKANATDGINVVVVEKDPTVSVESNIFLVLFIIFFTELCV